MVPDVSCYNCGRSFRDSQVRCPCGEPLWFDIDGTDFTWPTSAERSIWRYAAQLPTTRPVGLGTAIGGTPLVRLDRLDAYAGCRIHCKLETVQPTGSFKDRGSAVGVAWAVEHRSGRVGTVSHGNMARSMAACAASAGIDCVVLVPEDIPPDRLAPIASYNPTIVRVDGPYSQLYTESFGLGADHGIRFVNSDTPLRVAGQKTMGFEICESFIPDLPDAIVLPVSSGGLASAIWKALRELDTAGLISTMPRLYLVQAAACDPIAAAYRAEDSVEPITADDTVAYSIANADPPSGNRALAAVKDTGGAVCSVSDEAILEAQSRLSTVGGLAVEPAGAVPLAGTRHFVAHDDLEADASVVLVATGMACNPRSDQSVEAPTIPLASLVDHLAGSFRSTM